jgi:hypothetical protein
VEKMATEADPRTHARKIRENALATCFICLTIDEGRKEERRRGKKEQNRPGCETAKKVIYRTPP